MKLRSILVFTASGLVGAIFAESGPAHAEFARWTSTFYCQPNTQDVYWGGYGISNPSTTTVYYYACGVANDSDFNLRQVAGLDASGIWVSGDANGNGSVGGSACRANLNTQSGACGTWAYNSVSGPFVIELSRSAWINASYDTDLPYIALSLNIARNGTYNIVRGFKTRKP
jgi:hypothetical protein